MSQELNGTLTNSANLVGTFGNGGGGGTNNYNDLANKPQINGVTLQGNKTTSNLNISYNDLTNKPTIPAAQVNSDWNSTSGVSEILNKPSLAAVATTGSYNDLTNTPIIPAAQVNSDWNSTSGVSEILNKPSLAAVATSGSYSDLSGTPTIPVNSDFALSGLSDTNITTPQANQVLAYDGDNWVNKTLNIINPPDLSNISRQALTNDVATEITSTGKWYQVRAINGGTSGTNMAYILDSTNTYYLSANSNPQGSYVRATTDWLYFPSGSKFYARASFTADSSSGLFSASPLSV